MRPYTRNDFDHSPMLVFYEMTRACDLACIHCRADAQPACHPQELSPAHARHLVDELTRFPRPPLLVLTGGDPLKRADVFDLVDYCRQRAVPVAMTPSATPLVTSAALRRLKEAGLHRLAVSLDGADASTHDAFRLVPGSYARTLAILTDARAVGLPVQINVTVGRHNVGQLERLLEIAAEVGACLCSVFFLIPTGRATAEARLSAEECEQVFELLWRWQKTGRLPIKTTEAPHYRRFILQRQKEQRLRTPARHGSEPPGFALNGTVTSPAAMPDPDNASTSAEADPPMRAGRQPVAQGISLGQIGTNDGKGILFVSHIGEIYPSGFLPIPCGQFPLDSLVRIYQQAKLLLALRDSDQLGGKCGECEYRTLCGGSRARAYALTGDPLAAEPDCAYIPPQYAARA